MHPHTYNVERRHACAAVLERAHRTVIACAPEDDEAIYGWVCGEIQPKRFVLHYVWVRSYCRGMGLGAKLLSQYLAATAPGLPVVVSHVSDRARTIAYAKHHASPLLFCERRPFLRYNPVLSYIPSMEVAL